MTRFPLLDDFAGGLGLGVIAYLIYFGLCVVGGW